MGLFGFLKQNRVGALPDLEFQTYDRCPLRGPMYCPHRAAAWSRRRQAACDAMDQDYRFPKNRVDRSCSRGMRFSTRRR